MAVTDILLISTDSNNDMEMNRGNASLEDELFSYTACIIEVPKITQDTIVIVSSS